MLLLFCKNNILIDNKENLIIVGDKNVLVFLIVIIVLFGVVVDVFLMLEWFFLRKFNLNIIVLSYMYKLVVIILIKVLNFVIVEICFFW